MKINRIILYVSCLFVSLVVASCADDNLVKLAQKNSPNVVSTSTISATAASSGTTSTQDTGTPPADLVSFSNQIQPILFKYNCAGCHGNGYYAYPGVSSLARSGQLLGTMSWAPGYRQMPRNQKATSAELTLISNWIAQGVLNN
jgi:hypothetical protein